MGPWCTCRTAGNEVTARKQLAFFDLMGDNTLHYNVIINQIDIKTIFWNICLTGVKPSLQYRSATCVLTYCFTCSPTPVLVSDIFGQTSEIDVQSR